MYKAVIFDLGGVVFGSPIEGINEYEKLNNLPPNFINIFIVSVKNNAFRNLERGKLSISQFQKQFKKELDSPLAIDIYIEYMKKRRNIDLNREDFPKNGFNIDTVDMFNRMRVFSSKIHKEMIHCLFMLRGLRYITIALTNNFVPMTKYQINPLLSYFDEIIQSAVIGIRKPNPKIFKYALNRINKYRNHDEEQIGFENVVFLDDIGGNLKSASNLGIKTIKVNLNKQMNAIKELEYTLNVNQNVLLPISSKLCKMNIFDIQCILYGNAANTMVIVLNYQCLEQKVLNALGDNGLFVILAMNKYDLNKLLQIIKTRKAAIIMTDDMTISDIEYKNNISSIIYMNNKGNKGDKNNDNTNLKIPTLTIDADCSVSNISDVIKKFVKRNGKQIFSLL